MAEETKLALLQKRVVYDGEEYSRDSLQQSLKPELAKHTARIQELESLKKTHDQIAREMTDSLVETRSVWDCVKEFATGDRHKMNAGLRGLMERIPLLRGRMPERPISELLQERVQLTELRIREVGNFLDRMESEVENTRQDIARLNNKMLAAVQNKEKAASYILELREIEKALAQELLELGSGASAAHRQKQTEIDEVKRLIWEHGAKLRMYANADERIYSIVKMNNNFMELLTNLHTNMLGLYDSSQEVLDESRGNLASLSTATEASELTMDMQRAMQSLKESVNKVAALASSTSLYLTQNVEKLTSEMRVYDADTEKLIASNLAAEREIQERRIDETLQLAQREQKLALGGQTVRVLP